MHVLQDGQDILVKKHAIDRKGQGLPGETKAVDGITESYAPSYAILRLFGPNKKKNP